FSTGTPFPPIYTLSLHDALPIYESPVVTIIETVTSVALCDSREPPAHGTKIYGYVSTRRSTCLCARSDPCISYSIDFSSRLLTRSEEHTSELQSRENLVCRLLLE